jgi:hypothetical protein
LFGLPGPQLQTEIAAESERQINSLRYLLVTRHFGSYDIDSGREPLNREITGGIGLCLPSVTGLLRLNGHKGALQALVGNRIAHLSMDHSARNRALFLLLWPDG